MPGYPKVKPIRNPSLVSIDFWGQPVYEDEHGVLQCPGFVGNTYADYPWDYVLIGAGDAAPVKTPGLAEVSVEKFRDLDKKKTAGTDGARLTIHGIEPALVEIRLTIWTPDQWEKLAPLWETLFPGPQKVTTTKKIRVPGPSKETNTFVPAGGGQPAHVQTTIIPTFKTRTVTEEKTVSPVKAYDCYHPQLKLHGVKSLVFLRGEGPVPGSNARTKVFTMKCVEFLPPGEQTTTVSPDASAPQKTSFSKDASPLPGASGEGQKP